MSAGTTELEEFHQFLGDCLRRGPEFTTAEEALEAWRAEHPVDDDATADLEAALAELRSGDAGLSLDEFNQRFRARHGLS
uniref:Uncharacterized protein n=1 Tax=Schlesneria paludicola TaxID=360056 RepID=A0A7C2JZ98_9PLAN